jgi:biopolymer transport protein ExbD
MKRSHRAKRMERHHARRRPAALNVVSLMDIFTILVFFLLVNTGDVQNLPSTSAVELPESISEAKPRETVVVLVTPDDILLEGRPIAGVEAVMAGDGLVIEGLQQALLDQASRSLVATEEEEEEGLGEVTIMGDRTLPYDVLKRVMATVTEAGFSRVSLAVLQQAESEA